MSKFKIDPFVFAIILTVTFAYVFPFLGNKELVKPLLLAISSVGISLIFFFYGLKLNYTIIKEVVKKLESTPHCPIGNICFISAVGVVFLPVYQNRFVSYFMVGGLFSSSFAFVCFRLCGNGCCGKRQCSRCDFQCQSFWNYWHFNHADLDELFHSSRNHGV